MPSFLIKNAFCINEGQMFKTDVLIENGVIAAISANITAAADKVIDANGKVANAGHH